MQEKFLSENPEKKEKLDIDKTQEEFEWGKVDVVDIKPENEKSENPVLFAPGWSLPMKIIQKGPLENLAGKGRRVISLAHPRFSEDSENIDKFDKSIEKAGIKNINNPSEQARKAFTLLSVLERKQKKEDFEKVDAVGYSEGGVNLLLLAHTYPEKFNSVVLMNPSGITTGKNVDRREVIKRFAGELGNLVLNSNSRDKLDISKGVAKYIVSNPKRSIQESKESSVSNTLDIIREVREKGVKVVIISSVNDELFSAETSSKSFKSDEIDGFVSVQGRHFNAVEKPNVYMKAIDELLTSADKIKK